MTDTASDQGSAIDKVRALVGHESGPTDWYDITQERIDAFAEATGDFQFIHVDPERAKATPLGTTIAHGLLTLSLGPMFSGQLDTFGSLDAGSIAMALNYGYDKVRFTAPVPVNSRLRARSKVADVKEVPGGVQVTTQQTFEIEGQEKPVCVTESLVRLYFAPGA
jgi:acyl dehydratase